MRRDESKPKVRKIVDGRRRNGAKEVSRSFLGVVASTFTSSVYV